jgi:hypothetical protein
MDIPGLAFRIVELNVTILFILLFVFIVVAIAITVGYALLDVLTTNKLVD